MNRGIKRKLSEFLGQSDTKKTLIVNKVFVEKKSQLEASKELRVSTAYVSKIVRQFREGKDVSADYRLTNGGNNKKLKKKDERRIKAIIREEPTITIKQLKDKVADSGPDVSASTIYRSMKSGDFKLVALRGQVDLSAANRAERVRYCTENLNNLFTTVCFTDESSFQLYPDKKRVWQCSKPMRINYSTYAPFCSSTRLI